MINGGDMEEPTYMKALSSVVFTSAYLEHFTPELQDLQSWTSPALLFLLMNKQTQKEYRMQPLEYRE